MNRRTPARTALPALVAAVLAISLPAPGVLAQSTGGLCPDGQVSCVDAVIREMRRRFNPLVSSCNHDAVFALTYLRTTQEYRRAVSDPDFFADNAFVNHEDVVFADYYFRAYDTWHRGSSNLPAAWRLAFRAADRKAVTGTGNLLLGMNAHVNRDLPFVLERVGLVAPDGSSRKPDHDRVNDILARVNEPVIDESARRLDPTIDDGRVDGTSLDDEALLQLLVGWREQAWRNAERLASAPTPADRALVAQQIEDAAAQTGRLLAEQYAYRPPLSDPRARDRWCAAHWDDQ